MKRFLILLAAIALPASAVWSNKPKTLNAVEDAYPAISPDGRTMVFQSNRLRRVALFFADADGANPRLFIDPGHEPVSPNWSPDGRHITYAGTIDGDSEVFIVDVATKSSRRLTSSKSDDSHPIFSPDGQRIYFSSNRHTPDMSIPWGRQWNDTFSIRLDGSDIRQHTNCRAACTYPAPSPDGKQLAYRKLAPEPGLQWGFYTMPLNSQIYVSNIDGSNERVLASDPAFDGWPAWSPDGRLIAFASNRAGPAGIGNIWLIRPDGSGLTALTTGEEISHTQPRWAPDSSKIYVAQGWDQTGAIGVIDVPSSVAAKP